MATGTCRHCGYQPVAFDALICGKCTGMDPNPSQRTKLRRTWGSWCLLLTALLFVGAGVAVGWMMSKDGMVAILGGLVGLLPGMFIGMAMAEIVVRVGGSPDKS